MSYRIVPRTEYGLPEEVRSSGGSLRPPLYNEPMMTAHYTGVNTVFNGRDVEAQILRIQEIFSDTKPFEYNYVISQNDDNLIHEFAGKFRAAHSGGENDIAFGVLFLNGVNEPITDVQQDKWRWLRDVLIADGSLRADVDQRKHRDMPGAATACPGALMDPVWPDMLEPYTTPATPDEGDIVYAPKVIKLEGQAGAFAQWQGFKTWLPTPSARDAFCLAYGVSVTQVTSTAMFVAAGPIVGPVPRGYNAFGVKL